MSNIIKFEDRLKKQSLGGIGFIRCPHCAHDSCEFAVCIDTKTLVIETLVCLNCEENIDVLDGCLLDVETGEPAP